MRREIKFKLDARNRAYKYRTLKLCGSGVDNYFKVNKNSNVNWFPIYEKEIVLVFSDRYLGKHSYKIECSMEESMYNWYVKYDNPASVYYDATLDGEDPHLLWDAEKYFKRLWNEGYNYVRCEIPS